MLFFYYNIKQDYIILLVTRYILFRNNKTQFLMLGKFCFREKYLQKTSTNF